MQDPEIIDAEVVGPPATSDNDIPRLGIGHLMVWTAATAVLLTAFRGLDSLSTPNEEFRTERIIGHMTYSMLIGVAWTALAITLYWWRRRRKFNIQPGHWLLLGLAVIHLVRLCIYAASQVINDGHGFGEFGFLIFETANNGTLIVGLIVPAFGVRKSGPWLSFFLFLILIAWLYIACLWLDYWNSPNILIFNWYLSVGLTRRVAELAVLIVVLFLDRGANRQRNWLHWTGVALFSIEVIHQLAWTTYYGFFLN